MFKPDPIEADLTLYPKVTFLNSVFLFAGIVAFGMGFFRWQSSVVLGSIDFVFSLCSFALVYYLNNHKERVATISSIALALSYCLFTAIYLLAPYNTSRISLFFLLSASAFFLKGRQAGFAWLILILTTVVVGHFLSGFDTAYSHIDIVTTSLYLLALFFIFINYEKFKEKVNERDLDKEVLRLSEERFRTMVENGNDIIGIISDTGMVRFISPSVGSVLGFEPGEVIGKPVNDLIHPDDQPKAATALANAMSHPGGETLERYEFRMKHKDGSYRDIEMVGRNLIGNPVIGGIVLNGRDITERKRNEEKLRTLSTAVEQSPLSVVITDLDAVIQYVNPHFTNATGYSSGEIIGQNPRTLQSGQTPKETYVELWDALTSGKIWRGELINKRKNGELYWEEAHIAPVVNAAGATTHYVAVKLEITERKKAELALKQYKIVIDTVNDGFWITDAMGNMLEANMAYARMSGYSVGELVNMHISQLEAIERSEDEVGAHIEKVVARGHERFETRHRHKDGHEIDVEVSATFMPELQQFFVFIHDITKRKQAEAGLIESEASIRAILDNLPYLSWLKDIDGRYIRVNKAYVDYTGLGDIRQIIGKTDFDLWPKELAEKYHNDDAEIITTRRQKHIEELSFDGSKEHWVETFKTSIIDEKGNVLGTVGFSRDITERKQAEEQIRTLAFYDALTKLPNRRLLNDRLEQTMAASKRSGHYGALMFLDLDNFKPLNDTHGHGVGDLLLVEVAHRLTGCVREVDTVARFGGDEFVVMLGELDTDKAESTAQARIVAEKIRAILAEPYLLKIQQEGKAEMTVGHHCAASIGVVVFNSEASSEDVLKWADMAMYQAKERGRNQVHFFDSKS